MHAIAFICSANLCRSPMAHAIFAAEAKRRNLPVDVLSAGTIDFGGALAVREARLLCDGYNTPMPKFISTCVTNVDLSGATRVFVMERNHVETLLTRGISPDRISLLGEFDPQSRGAEIEDPIGQDPEAFERCYNRLRECIVHYLDTTKDFDDSG
jgi:protein-tyrosine phosphatase